MHRLFTYLFIKIQSEFQTKYAGLLNIDRFSYIAQGFISIFYYISKFFLQIMFLSRKIKCKGATSENFSLLCTDRIECKVFFLVQMNTLGDIYWFKQNRAV